MKQSPAGLPCIAAIACCSAIAALEAALASQTLQWTPAHVLYGRSRHAAAFDAARGRLVLFGGRNSNLIRFDDTWEWDGTAWAQPVIVTKPDPRLHHAMAYDAARGRIVLFGGQRIVQNQSDTWEFDGADWTRRFPAVSPPPRSGHAIAYDAARQETVLFGGSGDLPLGIWGDTWVWDGTTWTQRSASPGPGPRTLHAMAYDEARQRIVLFGGSSLGPTSETWEWDGTRWLERFPATIPPFRVGHQAAYDAARQRVVLYGQGDDGTVQIWEWAGSDWVPRLPTRHPTTAFASLTWDSVRRRIVLFGGEAAGPLADNPADTWEWDGSDWHLVAQGPPRWGPRLGQTLAYHEATRSVVAFGGTDPAGRVHGDTREWSGGAWVSRTPATSPPARGGHAMTYDAARRRTVLFGGRDTIGVVGDTWEWDGTTWTQSGAPGPAARIGHALAFDEVRQRVVLFGGIDAGQNRLGDTWEWDGTQWLQRLPSSSPMPREAHAMAYDSARQRVVLFGGGDPYADTWEWDGTTWTQRFPPSSPPGRYGPAMAYDAGRQKVVLVGGMWGDVWEWDGTTWAPQAAPRLGGHSPPAMAYDKHARRLVLQTLELRTNTMETWLGSTRVAVTQAFGTGCAGSRSVPQLAGTTPFLGNPAVRLDLLAGRPSSPCAFGLAPSTQSLNVGGGCTLYLRDPVMPVPAATNGSGFATLTMAVPTIAALRGTTLYAQAFVFDPAAALGLSFTAGRALVLGD